MPACVWGEVHVVKFVFQDFKCQEVGRFPRQLILFFNQSVGVVYHAIIETKEESNLVHPNLV